ncbi:uncharacterized protein LOC121622032 isoform X2 [Chelmon rostratus]|uniref:uncharacterized protein LOC121622032 isoform X2 n=1 Tax=Chelmon rostratus TaxID=109905 RepID=UPI001BEBAA5B|nr:uncharacterized protein LOC121622032 isoform X2 [Chelmon rostratus]
MVEFRWIKMSLFLMLVLQFTDLLSSVGRDSFFVRVGDGVTLPCDSAINDQHKCDRTTWTFSVSRSGEAKELVKLGQVAEPSSDRLSVLQNCSLVIQKVTVEDVGRYKCQQNKSGGEQGSGSGFYLSVISMTELKDTDKVTFNCSVVTYERCTHTVQWSFNGNNVDKDNQDLKMSQSSCFASLRFLSSHYFYTSRYKLLKCKVTNGNKVQQFDLSPQPSGEKPGEDTRTATTQSTTTKLTRRSGNSMKAGTMTTASPTKGWWWLYVIAAVLLVALLMIVVGVIRRRRSEGNKTRTNNNVADPEDGVSYASVSYTKKANSKAPVRSKNDDDEGDAVTYTTVKASSYDPKNLYATIN